MITGQTLNSQVKVLKVFLEVMVAESRLPRTNATPLACTDTHSALPPVVQQTELYSVVSDRIGIGDIDTPLIYDIYI